jgi:hypothetical protein
MLMFVNGLEHLSMAYVAEDTSNYRKFMCVYCRGGMIQEYKRHQYGGFNTPAEAIGWYFERFPAGNVMSESEFLSMQNQLLMMKLPSAQASTFDPTHMTTKPRPVAAKKDANGKLMSDFE